MIYWYYIIKHDKILLSLCSEFMVTLYISMVSKSISSQEVFLELDMIFRLWTVHGAPQLGILQSIHTKCANITSPCIPQFRGGIPIHTQLPKQKPGSYPLLLPAFWELYSAAPSSLLLFPADHQFSLFYSQRLFKAAPVLVHLHRYHLDLSTYHFFFCNFLNFLFCIGV